MKLAVEMCRSTDLSRVRVDAEKVIARARQQTVVNGSIFSCKIFTYTQTHTHTHTHTHTCTRAQKWPQPAVFQ